MKKRTPKFALKKCGRGRSPFQWENVVMNGPLRQNAKCWVSNLDRV